MRISQTIHDSIVDGPGLRYVVFTQGCHHHCPDCHNPGTHDPAGGKEVPVEKIIQDMESNPLTDGLTLTGGEPFLQIKDCTTLAKAARARGLSVWCYSGWTIEELLAMPEALPLLKELDVLVDGPFLRAQRSLTLPWRGSENQRIIQVQEILQA